MEDPLISLVQSMTRFTELLGTAEGDEPVPGCPGWTVADLATHLGTVHRWAAGIVLSGQSIKPPTPIVTEPLDEWYAGTATALVTALQAVDPDEPVPNFARIDEVAAFWPRRQLHETTVHAVDLAQALGHPEYQWGLEAEVAADGVSEVIRVFLRRMVARGASPVLSGPVRLVSTDLDREWIVAPGPEHPVSISHDVEVVGTAAGTAEELYLVLWGRLPIERVNPTGAAADFLAGPTVP